MNTRARTLKFLGFLTLSLGTVATLGCRKDGSGDSEAQNKTENNELTSKDHLLKQDYNSLFYYLFKDGEINDRVAWAQVTGAILRFDAYLDGKCTFNGNSPESDQNPARKYWRYSEPQLSPECNSSSLSEKSLIEGVAAASEWTAQVGNRKIFPLELLTLFFIEGGHYTLRDKKEDIAKAMMNGRIINAVQGGPAEKTTQTLQVDDTESFKRIAADKDFGIERLEGISTNHHMGIDQMLEGSNSCAVDKGELCIKVWNKPGRYLKPRAQFAKYLNRATLSRPEVQKYFPSNWESAIVGVEGFSVRQTPIESASAAHSANTWAGLTEGQAAVILAGTFLGYVEGLRSPGSSPDPELFKEYYSKYNGGTHFVGLSPNAGLAGGQLKYFMKLCEYGRAHPSLCAGVPKAIQPMNVRTGAEAVDAFARLWDKVAPSSGAQAASGGAVSAGSSGNPTFKLKCDPQDNVTIFVPEKYCAANRNKYHVVNNSGASAETGMTGLWCGGSPDAYRSAVCVNNGTNTIVSFENYAGNKLSVKVVSSANETKSGIVQNGDSNNTIQLSKNTSSVTVTMSIIPDGK